MKERGGGRGSGGLILETSLICFFKRRFERTVPTVVIVVFFLVSEGRRAPGINTVWVARNRFAVLDKQQNVSILAFI